MTTPKRSLLASLTRDELLCVVERFAVEVGERRVNERLVEAVALSERAVFSEVLLEVRRSEHSPSLSAEAS